MLSSDDSFGWSATSDGTMSLSEDDNASQASSVVERKLQKKQLQEKVKETDQASTDMQRNGFFDASPSERLDSTAKKKKKKQKIQTEDADTVMEPYEDSVKNISIKSEHEHVSTKLKKKKNMNQSEQEDTNADEESTSINYIQDKNIEKQKPQSESGLKQEDLLYTQTKKKPMKQKTVHLEVSVCDDSFSENIKPEDKLNSPTKKKSKKLKAQEELEKPVDREVSVSDHIIKQEDEHNSAAQKKRKKQKAHKEVERPVDGEANACENYFSEHIIKREDKHNSPAQKKNKKQKADKEVERPIDGEASVSEDSFSEHIIKREDKQNSPAQKKSKKHKAHKEVERPVDGEASVYEDYFSEHIFKREDKPHTQKKSKKRKAEEELENQVDESQTQDESFPVPPKFKKRKKHKEPINDIEVKPDNEINQSQNTIVEVNGTIDKITTSKPFSNGNKNNSVSLINADNIELLKQARERSQDGSNKFDEASIENRRREESSSSLTIVSSPKQKNKSSSTGSEHRHRSHATVSTSRRPSSSSSDSDLSTSHTQDKVISKRKSKSSQGVSENKYDKYKKSLNNSKTHIRLSDHAIIKNTSSSFDSEGDISKVNKPSVSVRDPLDHASKRISLSEKITFEDDSDDAFNSEKGNISPNKDANTPLNRFIEKNPQLKYVKCNTAEEAIDSDDEIWVLQCPKDCEVSKLQGIGIVVDTRTKIKIDGQAYDGVLEEGTHRLAILTASIGRNTFEIKNVKPKGTIRFRKRIPKVHMAEAAPAPAWRDAFIPLPDTKRRHPLFGHDYKKLIKLPSAVAERLHHPPRRFISKSEHTKRERTPDQLVHEELTQEDVVIKKKKKKKRKLSETGYSEMITKKLKHDPDEVWDSEKAIEKSLFDF